MEKDEGFISDGMNAFERNVKRIVDCLMAGIALIIFSPLFDLCGLCNTFNRRFFSFVAELSINQLCKEYCQ